MTSTAEEQRGARVAKITKASKCQVITAKQLLRKHGFSIERQRQDESLLDS